MSGRKWCLSPVSWAVLVLALAGPTLSEGSASRKGTSTREVSEIGVAANGAQAGTIAIRTEALDLSLLTVADFGDLQPGGSD